MPISDQKVAVNHHFIIFKSLINHFMNWFYLIEVSIFMTNHLCFFMSIFLYKTFLITKLEIKCFIIVKSAIFPKELSDRIMA